MAFRFFKMSNKSHRKMDHARSEAMRWVTMPFQVLGLFFSSVAAVVAAWWSKRNLRYLLQGIPALLVFVGVVVVGVYVVFQDRTVLASSYQAKAQESLREAEQKLQQVNDASKPLALAQSYFNRLTYLQPDSADNRFALARTYQQRAALAANKARTTSERLKNITDPVEKESTQKDLEKSIEDVQTMEAATLRLMSKLAPSDKKGYGRAHLWMFENLYRMQRGPDGKAVPPTPEAILEAERHLLHALEWPGQDVILGAHFGLAKLYRDTSRIDDAKKHLAEVAGRFPEYRLTLAQWAKAQGENELVISHAKAAENAFRSRLTTSLDDHEARFGLVECLLLQNKYAESQELINIGATLSSSQDIIRAYAKKMTQLFISWADFKENDPKSNFADRLTLLDGALRLDPDNPELFNRLMKLMKDKTPESEKAREVFRKFAVDQDKSAMAQLFLGIDAFQQDRAEEARYHWEKAFALSSGAPLVANNLAWAVAFYPPVDLPRALEMANTAVARAPNEARFKGTRGHILNKMKRYKEALPDLEASVKVYGNDPNLFKALSEACSNLGYTKMAAEYKAREESLRGKGGATIQPAVPGEKKDSQPADIRPQTGSPASGKPPSLPAAPPKEEPKQGTKPPG